MSLLKDKKTWTAASVLIALTLAVLFMPSPAVRAATDLPVITVTSELPERALTGAQVELPKASALASDGKTKLGVTLRASRDGEVVSAAVKESYRFTQKGNYNFYYEAYDPASGFYASRSFDVDVRDVWIQIRLEGETPSSGLVGVPCRLAGAYAVGIDGQRLEGASFTVSVTIGALPVESSASSFTPGIAGKYLVTYTASKGGETAAMSHEVSVTGSKPSLTVRNIPGQIDVGVPFTIPEAEAFDAAGGAVALTVKVSFEGKEIAVSDRTFTPEKRGVYRVVYTAVNSLGIPAEQSFEVEAVESNKGCGCGVTGGLAAILPGAFALVLAGILRNKKTSDIRQGS